MHHCARHCTVPTAAMGPVRVRVRVRVLVLVRVRVLVLVLVRALVLALRPLARARSRSAATVHARSSAPPAMEDRPVMPPPLLWMP
jgi:hypothetical protein